MPEEKESRISNLENKVKEAKKERIIAFKGLFLSVINPFSSSNLRDYICKIENSYQNIRFLSARIFDYQNYLEMFKGR